MLKDHYDVIRKKKDDLWWFRGRRELFSSLLRRNMKGLVENGLDAGCGPMTNESLYGGLAERWIALDHSMESFRAAPHSPDVKQVIGGLDRSPIRKESADLILLLDVLEHTDDDRGVIGELESCLKKGGLILISVPAFKCLWSRHDEQAGHRRRYRSGDLIKLCEENGLKVLDRHYFNASLFLPIYIARKILKMLPAGRKVIESDLSPGFADPFLRLVLSIERWISFNLFRMPFGTSFVLLARKNDE
ncbi:MAG TPA: methyltransferase domain-containing protein [Acidobacteriota bacterium]|nr:methyltransferase domain-containing protein [Acidobacteriota bacterium]